MRKAIFLDRDGTINKDPGWFHDPDAVVFEDRAVAGLKLLSKDFLLVVVSNQSGIAKSIFSKDACVAVNEKIQDLLEKEDILIQKFYCCPHAECAFRKPNPGMVFRAAKEFSLDLSHSWIIGDKTSDIKLAENVALRYPGFRSILVQTGFAGSDNACNSKPTLIAKHLEDAAAQLLSTYRD